MDMSCYKTGCTPLSLAVANQHIHIAAYLLKKGASPNCVDVHGESPVFIAAKLSSLPLLQLLLKKGADVTLRNSDGETALCCAAKGSNARAC